MSKQCTSRGQCQCMRSKNQPHTDGNQARNNVDKGETRYNWTCQVGMACWDEQDA